MTDEPISSDQITEQLRLQLPTWQYLEGKLFRRYKTAGWKSTLMIVNLVGHYAEAGWHHPDLEVSYDSVAVNLVTHSAGGVTQKDFELATKIEESVLWRPEESSALDGVPDDARFAYVTHD